MVVDSLGVSFGFGVDVFSFVVVALLGGLFSRLSLVCCLFRRFSSFLRMDCVFLSYPYFCFFKQ